MSDKFKKPMDPTKADIYELMPEYRDIEEYGNFNRREWSDELFEDWFYFGIEELDLNPKGGIDTDKALKHIEAIMRSWEPKQEHKKAACVFLFEKWFESAKWECRKRKPHER